MILVSCNARLEFRARLDCQEIDEALELVKSRLHAAALQVALDLRRDGYVVDLNVRLLAHKDQEKN